MTMILSDEMLAEQRKDIDAHMERISAGIARLKEENAALREIVDALEPTHPRWNDRRMQAPHTIDITVRKDAKEHVYEGDFLGSVARALVRARSALSKATGG